MAYGVTKPAGGGCPRERLDLVRIASLLPAATEIVVALGLADQLVAVTFECSAAARAQCPVVVDTAIPPDLTPAQVDGWVRDRAARGLPLYALDRAALAAAAPDLVLTQDLCRVCALPAATVAEACRVIGIDADVLSVDPHSVDDVLDMEGPSSCGRRRRGAVRCRSRRRAGAMPFRRRAAARRAARGDRLRGLRSCRQAPPWSMGSKHWRGRCIPMPSRRHRRAASPPTVHRCRRPAVVTLTAIRTRRART